MITKTEKERRKKISKAVKNRWNDPEYRKMMMEKQKKTGWRTFVIY